MEYLGFLKIEMAGENLKTTIGCYVLQLSKPRSKKEFKKQTKYLPRIKCFIIIAVEDIVFLKIIPVNNAIDNNINGLL